MLQHNNNNNYPCLDVAHKELLHGCRRNSTTFSSALGFSAIPLIKGLRAWAVSGGYSRSKRKTAASSQLCDPAHLSRIGTNHLKTHPFQTPGVRQCGLGALVTVATLKDSDGGRQTQTRCLVLKAEGCNYLCAVGTRVDRRKAGKGCQDGIGICDSNPVRKWRKSNKRAKSIENIAVVENKEATATANLELLDKCSITQCLTANSGLTVFNNDEDELNRSKISASHELCEPDNSSKIELSTEVKEKTALAFCPKLKKCNVFVGPISSSDCTHKTTEISNKSDLNYVLKSHDRNESGVSERLELVSELLSKNINKTNETLVFISHSHCEVNVLTPATSNHSEATLITVTQEEQKIKKRIHDSSSNPDMETGKPQKDANAITSSPNPTPTTNATALGSINRQQQEENRGMRLALKPELELLEKLEGENVVDEKSKVVDKEDEDEFGVFLKAGDEQVWNEGFNELKRGPCEKHGSIDIRNSSFLNNPSPWMADEYGEQSNLQSEDTWTAFTQEVVSNATVKDCWFSTALENMHLTDSSAITVPNEFLEASLCIKSTSENFDYIPTLTELLRGSAAGNGPERKGQNLLDKLQDLDRMIGVKYRLAESLSRKLLLQSLNLRSLNPGWTDGWKQNMARFSPNLPTSNQQLTANAKRRLSYDINRNLKS